MRSLRLMSFLLSALLASSAWAQPKAPPSKEATEAFKQAEAYFTLKDFEQALASYKKAYVLSREPLLLFNVGQCYTNLKKYQDAIDSYKTFLQEAPKSQQRALAESLIKDNEAELAKIKTTPPDKTPPDKTPPDKTPPDKSPESAPVKEPREPLSPKPFYAAAGGVAGVALVLDGVAVLSAREARKIQLDPNGDNTQIAVPFQRAKSLGLVADGLLVVAAGAGLYGFLLSKKSKKGEVSVALSPTGAQLNVSF